MGESRDSSSSRGEGLIREAFEAARGYNWDLEADDILRRVRRPERQVRRRVEVVIVAALILVVFFAPLPGVNLFQRLQRHGGLSPTGSTTVPTTFVPSARALSSGTVAYVSLANEQTGWAVIDTSDGGEHVLRTTNSGTTWADVTPSQLTALDTSAKVANGLSTPEVLFLGAESAWTSAAGKLIATDNGGASWRGAGTLPSSCVPVQFVDSNHGWCNAAAVGQGMSETIDLYRTLDGGLAWQHVESVDFPNSASNKGDLPYQCEKSFRFATPKLGWVGLTCGEAEDHIYETTDAGAHWVPRTIALPSALAKAQIVTMPPIVVGRLGAGVLTIDTRDTVMYRTNDAGRSWQTVVPPGGLQLWGADVISPLHWVLADATHIDSTTDGGRSWKTLTTKWPVPLGSLESNGAPDIQFASANVGWAELWDSKAGAVTLWRTKDGGAHWTAIAGADTGAAVSVRRPVALLKGSGTVAGRLESYAGDQFGFSVAISGDTAVVGCPYHAKGAGRGFFFTDTAKGWKQVAELKGSDTVANDHLGWSTAISGNTALVGAYEHARGAGRVYVFTRTAGLWRQTAELKAPDPAPGTGFGASVAISGRTAIVGTSPVISISSDRIEGLPAHAYVFTEHGTVWQQTAVLKGSDTVAGDQFASSLAISGTTAVVGAPGHDNNAGRAYLFTETAAGWTQTAEIKGSDTVSGKDLHESGSLFGSSVSIAGTNAVVGAANPNGGGSAYLFEVTATGWKQTAEVVVRAKPPVFFGNSVAVSGTKALVSDGASVDVFAIASTGWRQVAELQGSVKDGAFLAHAVSLSGGRAIVSDPYDNSGRADVFAA